MRKYKIISVFGIILAVVLALSAVGCSAAQPKPKNTAESVVSAALGDFQKGDISSFYSHFNLKDAESAQKNSDDMTTEAQLIGPKTTYKIVSSEEKISASQAQVKVEITRPDLTAVFAKAKKLASLIALNLANMSDEQVTTKTKELFAQALAEVTETKTVTVDVALVLVENSDGTFEWKISNESLYVPLFGDASELTIK